MVKVKCIISYDGTNFSGFQIQPDRRTVHGELEKALLKLHKGVDIRVHASGRTDTGVHAIGQVIHFESDYNIPENGWKRGLNTILPDDLYIDQVEIMADDFHARYHALWKEYHYFVMNTEDVDVFKRNYTYQFRYPLNIDAMKQACVYLEGTHDFTTFSSAKATVKGSKIRTIYEASLKQDGPQIEFIFRGSGFLYNMVRIIVGVLLDIGQGRRKPADIEVLLAKQDRKFVGETAPSAGLYLWQVGYEAHSEINNKI